MFIKYPSIEPHYREKFINFFISLYPKLLRETFIVQEKIHGSNIQLMFYPGQEFKIASREQLIAEDNGFYNIRGTLKDYEEVIKKFTQFSEGLGVNLNVYCELFGHQKEVDYGRKGIAIIDIRKDKLMFSPCETEELVDSLGISRSLCVPVLAIVKGLEAALEVSIEMSTILNPVEDNLMEGVVIKPYYKVYYSPVGETFLIKKKNEKFKENKSKKKKVPKIVDSELADLHEKFLEYLTKNRIVNIFSKHGEIQKPSEIGKYIQLVISDAVDDFMKDYSDVDFDRFGKKDRRFIFNGGKYVMKLLTEFL